MFGGKVRAAIRKFSGAVHRVATQDKVAALTFDDGPDPSATPELLEILAAHGAKATFFMTGERAAAHPELVAAVSAGGHAIGNHTWDHPAFPLISRAERRSQLRRCEAAFGGAGSPLFRPPYGAQNASTQIGARLAGYQVVLWNVEVPDWLEQDEEWLAGFVMERLRPGSIVLMHDGLVDHLENSCPSRGPTLRAVDRVLAAHGSEYEFVTVPELLRRGRPVRVNRWMCPDVDDFLNRLTRRSGNARRYDPAAASKPWLGYNQ